MERIRRRWRTLVGGLSGLLAGAAGGIVAIALLAGGASGGARDAGDLFMTAAHVPPLLTLPGERVTLRYAIVCPPPGGDRRRACDGAGDLYVRAGQSGPFERLPLSSAPDSAAGRYAVDVPDRIASSPDGFSYYAVLRDAANGGRLVVPAGGTDAPQTSHRLEHPLTVDLGAHVFGATAASAERVVDAAWGSGADEAGLSGGPTSLRIGPSSFDVAPDGTVTLLDEINKRVQRWRGGTVAATVPVDVPAATSDLAVGVDGTIYVLDGSSAAGSTPLLRTFAPNGTLLHARHIAERTWSQLRIGPRGPVVQQEPSEQWMPAADGATPLDRGAQARAATSGRPLADGSQLVVLRVGTGEVRLARVAGDQVRASWRVVSDTPLGEVQLAAQSGNRIVLVVKAYTETQDEFEVVVLDSKGVVRRFSVPSDQWADAAPLAYFRLAGGALYKLGTGPAGAFVDRYDLEVGR
jgi:hypothetical protein